ncbi:RNA-directed DNA polymerase, eukaryota, partial [Tanacetum coccineum]
EGILKDLFPRLYALESCKLVNVCTKLNDPAWWVWNLESSGDFSVSSIRKVIDEKRFPSVCSKTRWVKYVSIKVNVLAWKIKIDGLPTRFNISRRGIDIHSILCPVCDGGVESSEHLFFRCHLSKQIARKVSLWWNAAYVDVNSYAEWYSWIVSLRIAAKSKLMLEGVFYTMWWQLWTYRNKLLFDDKVPSKTVIFDSVVSSSFYGCRMAQDQVVTAEEKIFVDIICMSKGTSLEDIRSLFRFKGKDYIVKKPKGCIDVNPVIQVKMSETEETDIRTVPVVISFFDYN